MQNITRKKTEVTPEINFNAELKLMSLTGRCIPEDAFSFFIPLTDWLSNLFEGGHAAKTDEYTFKIDCDYYNSASAKMLVFMLSKVAEIQKAGFNLRLIWLYDSDDPDLVESVKDYMEVTEAVITMQVK